jgi:hypothetical protein
MNLWRCIPFASFLLLFFLPAKSQDPISISIVAPAAEQLADDTTLFVKVTISSTFEISTVEAAVGDRETLLAFNSSTNAYEGKIDLTGLDQGTLTVIISAMDLVGNSASASTPFIFDSKPILKIISPQYKYVGRPLLPVIVECHERNGVPCYARVEGGPVPIEAPTRLETLYDLSTHDGGLARVTFIAIDDRGQRVSEVYDILIEGSSYLREVGIFKDKIIDVRGNKVLTLSDNIKDSYGRFVVNETEHLAVHDLSEHNSEIIPFIGAINGQPQISSTGVWFEGTPLNNPIVYEWTEGGLSEIAQPAVFGIVAKHDYALFSKNGDWNQPDTLCSKNLITRQVMKFPTFISSASFSWDVGADGKIVYSTDGNIYAYDNGVKETIVSDQTSINPTIEADMMVYEKWVQVLSRNQKAIALHDFENETIIRDYRAADVFTEYQLNNGFISYVDKAGFNFNHVWLRDPSGEVKQITFFAEDSHLEAMNSNGDMVLKNNNGRYLSDKSGNMIRVGSDLGNAIVNGDKFQVIIGNTLYDLTTDCNPSEIISVSSDVANPYAGEKITLSLNGSLNSNTKWLWYKGFCGNGVPVGEGETIDITASENSSYYVRGEGFCALSNSECHQFDLVVRACESTVISSITADKQNVLASDTVTLTVNGTKDQASEWVWYKGECGTGAQLGVGESIQIIMNETAAFFARTEGGCSDSLSCAEINIAVKTCDELVDAEIVSVIAENSDPNFVLRVTGNLHDADNWVWYKDDCGTGEIVGVGEQVEVVVDQTTSFFVRGESTCPSQDDCTGLEIVITETPPFSKQDPLEIHPNPSHGKFYFSSTALHLGHSDITIFDLSGKEIIKGHFFEVTTDQMLDISSFPAGLYIVNIAGSGKRWRSKILKY